jgi:hypothetical protein
MEPISSEHESERNQLWDSLKALRPEIDRLALGEFEGSPRDLKMVVLLARIVGAELDFRSGAAYITSESSEAVDDDPNPPASFNGRQ